MITNAPSEKRWGGTPLAETVALAERVYERLCRLAAAKLSGEPVETLLDPTTLVHEAWLRLATRKKQHWNGESHFFAAAAQGMGRILIDRARQRRAVRHGGSQRRVDLDKIALAAPTPDDGVFIVREALSRLESEDRPKAELVKLRFFNGLTMQEAADELDISVATAKRRWVLARTWLRKKIENDTDESRRENSARG